MKNILLLSSIYPLPSNKNQGTPVCHYFTREWVKVGYNVHAVHIQAVYPRILYFLARLNTKRIAAKTGAVVYTDRLNHVETYEMDGVLVSRIPVYKPIPHGAFSSRSIREAVSTIIRESKKTGFVPDVIIGHFPNPQIELLSMLKKEYSTAKTCIVMHGDTAIMTKVYGKRLPSLMKDIDMWGFRNNAILREFEEATGIVKDPFMCFSGIPEKYITEKNIHDFSEPLKRFVYVGTMINRKYPEKIIDALLEAFPQRDFDMTYVGEGQQLGVIQQKIENERLEPNVHVLGRIPRDRIVEEYDKAECMVMISRGEAYGLVYLEAMARGCITIASRNEGFDGVIVDGENGFLCEAGNAKELATIIARINSMSSQERMRISENAINTARNLTDENAAKIYIDNVMSRLA